MMEAILQTTGDPSELVHVSDPQLPYRFREIFPGSARRLDRKRLKLLQRIDGAVRPLLAESERVEFVSWGIEYSFAEHYFMGVWAQLINRRALVFTDRRILILQIDSRQRLRELKSQVRYAAIEKLARGTLGYLSLVLRDGKKLTLTGIPRKDRKDLRERLKQHLEHGRASEPVQSRENLCPHCGEKVVGFPDHCRSCAGAFKSGSQAGWLSLMLPGLGDWYLGHRGLAVIELFGALVMWGVLGLGAVASIDAGDASLAAAGVMAAVLFTFMHGTDALITRRVGRKGIYPAERR
jgi:hypothetical protein